jgi:prepilin-type N-terminal cleavage/methylation domain-containing protein
MIILFSNFKNFNKRKQGFTFIEMIISLGIFAILLLMIGIILNVFSKTTEKNLSSSESNNQLHTAIFYLEQDLSHAIVRLQSPYVLTFGVEASPNFSIENHEIEWVLFLIKPQEANAQSPLSFSHILYAWDKKKGELYRSQYPPSFSQTETNSFASSQYTNTLAYQNSDWIRSPEMMEEFKKSIHSPILKNVFSLESKIWADTSTNTQSSWPTNQGLPARMALQFGFNFSKPEYFKKLLEQNNDIPNNQLEYFTFNFPFIQHGSSTRVIY